MSKLIPLLQTLFQNKGYPSQLWKTILEILNSNPTEIINFVSIIKNKINDYNQQISILALDLLDYTVDNGKMTLWIQISSKDFLSNLINILKTREVIDIQLKILYLIEKWGKNFKKYNSQIPNFFYVYKSLKDNDVNFPNNYSSSYEKYFRENNNLNNNIHHNHSHNKSPHHKKNSIKKIKSPIFNWNTIIRRY